MVNLGSWKMRSIVLKNKASVLQQRVQKQRVSVPGQAFSVRANRSIFEEAAVSRDMHFAVDKHGLEQHQISAHVGKRRTPPKDREGVNNIGKRLRTNREDVANAIITVCTERLCRSKHAKTTLS